jgi:sulfate adenylyltransferase (ADP) / ATP adenylyltransferase
MESTSYSWTQVFLEVDHLSHSGELTPSIPVPFAWRIILLMADQDSQLTPGTLHASLLERTANARRCGAVQFLPTTLEVIEQDGIPFQVRMVEIPAMKEIAEPSRSHVNPFPYDPDLFVAPISATHIALLNTFSVVEHHMLIATRAFEDQRCQLTQKDCEALLIGLTEVDALGFYNAGHEAGASKSHKHLQLVPLDATIAPLPIEALLRFAQTDRMIGTVPRLPFRHAFAAMDPDWTNPGKDSGASLHACYRKLLHAAGLSVDATSGSHELTAPYNLLMTRRWMLVVPRSQECFEGISVNALGFAGAFLVKNRQQLATLRRFGPMAALQHVTGQSR